MTDIAEVVNLNQKRALVKQQPCFAQLTDKELDELVTLFHEKHFSANDTIVVEGDVVDSVYLIVKGEADVRHMSVKDGKIHTSSIAVLKAGEAIGLNETGFYSLTGLRTATVVALSDMVLLRLSVAAFHGFSLSNTHVTDVMHKYADDLVKKGGG